MYSEVPLLLREEKEKVDEALNEEQTVQVSDTTMSKKEQMPVTK
ncbi:hypothetical protein [Segetibacter aerophilus]|nr:hypothetical protein [Segetibacter aerophilus]